MQNNYKVLIPGGTGFIGYHLCLFFIKKGWKVYSVSKSKPKKKRKVPGVKYIYCDVRNKKILKKKLDSYYDYIINLSGYVDHSNDNSIEATHFKGCKNLVNIFKKKKPKKFIQIGSSIEYGRVISPQKENKLNKQKTYSIYGMSKLLSTKYLLQLNKKYDFPVTILRLYLVYGPNQDTNRVIPITINNAIKNNTFDCSTGLQIRDFIYIDDLIKAIMKVLSNRNINGEILNIASGKPIQIKNAILKICNIVGYGNPQFGKIKFRKDEILRLFPSIIKAKRILKWKPVVDINLGLKKTIKYYKSN